MLVGGKLSFDLVFARDINRQRETNRGDIKINRGEKTEGGRKRQEGEIERERVRKKIRKRDRARERERERES